MQQSQSVYHKNHTTQHFLPSENLICKQWSKCVQDTLIMTSVMLQNYQVYIYLVRWLRITAWDNRLMYSGLGRCERKKGGGGVYFWIYRKGIAACLQEMASTPDIYCIIPFPFLSAQQWQLEHWEDWCKCVSACLLLLILHSPFNWCKTQLELEISVRKMFYFINSNRTRLVSGCRLNTVYSICHGYLFYNVPSSFIFETWGYSIWKLGRPWATLC